MEQLPFFESGTILISGIEQGLFMVKSIRQQWLKRRRRQPF